VELYLVRHAIAFDHDPAAWPDDRARPLTEKGKARMRKAAAGLRALGVVPEALLSSGLVRAWQTAELLRQHGDWPAPRECAALEVGRTPYDVLDALQPFRGAASVGLVSHEPNLHELAGYLLMGDGGRPLLEFRKGAVACLALSGEDPRAGTAALRWLVQPRVLRAAAE
jgi:phosphohistidine phosphatase